VPSGRRVRLAPYDVRGEAPGEGDVLKSATGSAAYLVLGAREVRRRDPVLGVRRFALDCLRLDDPGIVPDLVGAGAVYFLIRWYPRGRRRS